MKPAALRIEAEQLFVRHGRTIEDISSALSLSRGTVARWSKSGDWVRKRQEFLRESPLAPIETLKKQRLRVIELMPTTPAPDAGLADQLWKITRTIESLEARGDNIGGTLDVIERFARFVARSCDEATAEAVRAATERFLAEERTAHA